MLGQILRKGREDKGYKSLELARLTKIDGALISKFESSQRMPTLAQLQLFAELFELNFPSLHVQWIKEKILAEFGSEDTTLLALKEIIEEFSSEITPKQDPNIDFVLAEIEKLKAKLQGNS
jgi:transcriptional regulator with XRE-family HTH domain